MILATYERAHIGMWVKLPWLFTAVAVGPAGPPLARWLWQGSFLRTLAHGIPGIPARHLISQRRCDDFRAAPTRRSPFLITSSRSRQSLSRRRQPPSHTLCPGRPVRCPLLPHLRGAGRRLETRRSAGSRRVVREAGAREGHHGLQRPDRGPALWGFPRRTSDLGGSRRDPGTSLQLRRDDGARPDITSPAA